MAKSEPRLPKGEGRSRCRKLKGGEKGFLPKIRGNNPHGPSAENENTGYWL